MKRIILCLSLFVVFGSQAQQINPVPDYVFSNKMSVGRNAVTDTAAYFSIGPRYGAIRGFMPPMVTDTASVTGTKRNGLTIFSIQKNKYVYWDSVRVQWSDFAGSSGAYIFASDTASMLSPYIRHAGYGLTKSGQALSVDTASIATRARVQKGIDSLGAVKGSGTVTSVSAGTGMSFTTITSTGAVNADTNTLSTRAWRQKGDDSLASLISARVRISDTASMLSPYTVGSGTLNYVPKFTATRTLGNSQIFDNGTNVGIGTTIPAARLDIRGSGAQSIYLITTTNANTGNSIESYYSNGASWSDLVTKSNTLQFNTGPAGGPQAERLRIFANGRVGVNTTTDAGYQFDVAGSIRNTTGAAFATSSGNVGVGTTTNNGKFDVLSTNLSASGWGNINIYTSDAQAANLGGSISFGGLFSAATTHWASIGGRKENSVSGDYGGYLALATRKNGDGNNSERLRITSIGNVGIGTDSPSELLDVNGRIRARTIDSTSSPINVLTSDVNGVIRKTAVPSSGIGGSGTTNYLAKFTASGTVGNSIITDNGTQVGIGTASPTAGYELDVIGDIRASQTIAANQGFNATMTSSGAAFTGATSATSGSSLVASLRDNSTSQHAYQIRLDAGLVIHSATWTGGTGANMSHAWHTATSGGSVTERMRITSDGELLIATTTDAGDYKLQVAGNALLKSASSNTPLQIENTAGTLAYAYFVNTGGSAFIGSSNNDLVFTTSLSGTERMRMTSNGELLINTTSDQGDYKLQINGAIYNTTTITTGAPTGGTAAAWRLGSKVATNVQLDTANYIEVEIGGVFYRLAIVTPN